MDPLLPLKSLFYFFHLGRAQSRGLLCTSALELGDS